MSPKGGYDLSDYVDVPARIAWFFERYPEGSLQAEVLVGPETGSPVITVKAYAYRSLNDSHPGIGHASEVFPGTTPYTKGSELMNAETSAWGRALAAIGAPTKGHIASADEVRGASSRRMAPVKASEQVVESGAGPGEAEPGEGTVETGQPALPTPTEAGLPRGVAEDGATKPGPGHKHTFVQSPTLKKFVVCSDPACRKVVRKEEADAS
jgi:hypothetical protein